MLRFSVEQKIHYTLRLAIVMCFIGHGAFGIITKPIWCNYFAVFGIGKELAYRLMPFVGVLDIFLAIVMLIFPIRAIALWLLVWGIITALLRPLSGEPFAEFIERAGNFGIPVAFLLLHGSGKNIKDWFVKIKLKEQTESNTYKHLTFLLRIVVFLLFLGHGWLNLDGKKGLLDQYISLGFSNPVHLAQSIGIFEIAAAFTVLIFPVRSIVLALLIWKIASELFYPHFELFEWIERGGSYGALLTLWILLKEKSSYLFYHEYKKKETDHVVDVLLKHKLNH